MMLLNSVLVATDFGETSTAALAYGRNLARASGGKLHVLHIAEQVTATAASAFYFEDPVELQKAVEHSAATRLNALVTADDRARLGATPVVQISQDVARAIVDYAKAAHVDVIVVGTHGRGPVSHFVMGSVAEKVRTAPCPVLVVRPNEHEFIVPDPVGVHTRIRRLGVATFVMLLLGGVSAASAQTARTGPMMREKLLHTQRVLEALATSNHDLLDRESAALSRIAESPRWAELKTRELRPSADNFLKAVADLAAASKLRDLDAAAASYTALVTTCYQCHRQLKGMRIAK